MEKPKDFNIIHRDALHSRNISVNIYFQILKKYQISNFRVASMFVAYF